MENYFESKSVSYLVKRLEKEMQRAETCSDNVVTNRKIFLLIDAIFRKKMNKETHADFETNPNQKEL